MFVDVDVCMYVHIYLSIYLFSSFQLVYSQPIRIEAEKGRTLN